MNEVITLTKRICAAADGYQFLTSGFPNRSSNKKTFDSVDGLFVRKPLIEGLRSTESDIDGDRKGRQGIEVNLTLRRTWRKGYRKWWCFGYRNESRVLTQYKPRNVEPTEDGCTAMIKLGSMYLDQWTSTDYFPDIAPGSIFPVWVKATRKEEEV